jgi:hypothetical protein
VDGLSADAGDVLDAVAATPATVRADSLEVPGGRKRSDVVRELDRRLLLHVDEVHTESGRHAKVLQSWAGWAADAALDTPLPEPAPARAAFEAAVATFAPDRVAKLLPWPPEVSP